MRKKRRFDYVNSELVEKTRLLFGFKKNEFSELMGFRSTTQYTNCLRKGGFLSQRFDAALDAIDNAAMTKAFKSVIMIKKIKGLIGKTSQTDEEVFAEFEKID